ncbi:secretion-regulating guanine nucleotide exchange factor [Pseudophryne corroboree]|uniref:secretion-regulating guanine nucleotide exchange factor n=1 Tax=Pseudophryne corroboree TaxID=495146 RepID=UPI003081EE1B
MSGEEEERQLLCAWGSNSCGQLGLGSREDALCPQRVPGFPGKRQVIQSISGGGSHSAAVTDAGELYVCGQNKNGQLGLGHCEDLPRFSLCPAVLNLRVVKVSCGWDFSIILTENGLLLSCGSNAFNQLGIPQQKSSSVPNPVQNLKEKVVDIAAGLRHSLALTESGQTLQWGSGLASHAKRFCHRKSIHPFYTAEEPYPVPGLEDVKAVQVTAGSYHSVALSAAGELCVWGSNKHGQLLHPECFVLQPHRIERAMFHGEPIRAVWSGWSHLVAQTESGQVCSWGRSDYSQLGIDGSVVPGAKEEDDRVPAGSFTPPASVPGLAGAAQIACGSEHTLALCGNTVYSWGWNEHGMCGTGSEDNVPTPTAVCIPHSNTVKLIGCGAGHSMVLCVSSGQSIQLLSSESEEHFSRSDTFSYRPSLTNVFSWNHFPDFTPFFVVVFV